MYQVLPANPRRTAIGTAVLALALASCAACVGASTPAGAAGSSATTAAAGSVSGASTAGTPASGAASTAAAGSTGTAGSGGSGATGGSGNGSGGGSAPGSCQPRYLAGSIGTGQGTAGSVYVDILFKNLGSSPCTLSGYPGVSFGAGSPVSQVGQPADRNPQVSPAIVTLIPGGHAFAVLQIGDAGNYPATTCRPVSTSYLQVYPPNTTQQLLIAYSSTGCRGDIVTMHVEAVQPGTGPGQ